MICSAWTLAYFIRFHSAIDVPLGIPDPILYFRLVPFIAVIWCLTFFFTGLYKRSEKYRSAMREAADIIQCSAMATIIFIAFSYFYEEYKYSRINTLIFAGCHPILLILGRSLLRKIQRIYKKLHPMPKILMIGTNNHLKKTIIEVKNNRNIPSNFQSVICLDQSDTTLKSILKKFDIPLVQKPNDWIQFLIEQPISCAFIAVDQGHSFLASEIKVVCNQIPEIKIFPDFGNLSDLSLGIELVDGIPIINVHESPLSGTRIALKRVIDVIGSLTLLILLTPVFILIGLLVKFSSPGPIFYRQERMGLDGHKFKCIKFRSMPTNAEDKSGAIWATLNDGRATTVGKVLRRTSLDELPQLFNVLKGDMSLVGPRPERPIFVNEFRHKVPRYMLRHKVKAGITGWAQVNGWRGSTSIEKRIECDLYYIQNWSMWLDLKILLLTIEEVISGKDAY